MTARTFHLNFDGYWRERNRGGIPAASGIYCVYAGSYNPSSNTVSLRELVYIGESENVRDRIAGHEKWARWRRHLLAGEEIWFNCALIRDGRERAEAAMISKHKPPENTEYVDSFPYDTTTVYTTGRNALLRAVFTVSPTKAGLAAYW